VRAISTTKLKTNLTCGKTSEYNTNARAHQQNPYRPGFRNNGIYAHYLGTRLDLILHTREIKQGEITFQKERRRDRRPLNIRNCGAFCHWGTVTSTITVKSKGWSSDRSAQIILTVVFAVW
ncbi:unnamed protein product, partial [Ectocarpus sp. 4 AP-2014]